MNIYPFRISQELAQKFSQEAKFLKLGGAWPLAPSAQSKRQTKRKEQLRMDIEGPTSHTDSDVFQHYTPAFFNFFEPRHSFFH